MLDVIGIGALNVDYIATRQHLLARQEDLIPEITTRFEHGVERHVQDDEIDQTIKQMGLDTFDVFLGGSSFNTVHAIAHTNSGLKLGYIGVAGSSDHAPESFKHAMRALAIDTALVAETSNSAAGRCISYIADGERSLLTTPGANTEFASHVRENRDRVLQYLTSAKLVHLTSLFDSESPQVLLELLREAKRINPWLRVSFDPGHEWVKSKAPWLYALLRLSDYVFVNQREFEELGHHRPGTSDINCAKNIFQKCGDSSVLIVLKRYDSILLFYKLQGRLLRREFRNQILVPDVIEDATGAGDVFAAGFITGILVPGMDISHAVELGLRLARAKLLVSGYRCFNSYPGIFKSLLDQICAGVSEQVPIADSIGSECIFIGHGQNALWSVVKEHLTITHSLRCEAYESNSHVGEQIADILSRLLEKSTFAVIIATADDAVNDGLKRARQNVLHEIGLFQGKLGQNRVALMVQHGVEEFSNISGLQVIRFHGNSIHEGFYELDRVLRRERLVA